MKEERIKKLVFTVARWALMPQEYSIHKLDNGYLFNQKYYKSVETLSVDLTKYLKEYFNED